MPARTATALAEVVTIDHPINRKLSAEFVDLTPALAEKFLSKNLGNRNLRPGAMLVYAREMRNKHWLTTGDTIKFDWNGRMIDGQHRCESVIESGVTIRVLVVRGLDPRVQDVLDQNVKRSAADALRFNGYERNTSIIAASVPIAISWENGFLRTSDTSLLPKATNQEILEWVAENPLIVNAAALASRLYRDIEALPSALSFAIWKLETIDAPAAIEFLESSAQMRTNGASDPRVAMVKRLRQFHIEDERRTSAKDIYTIFRAWNAWRDGKPLSKIQMRGPDGGLNIPEPK